MPRLTLIGGVLWGNRLYSASLHAAVVVVEGGTVV